jgi:hypothetical protein
MQAFIAENKIPDYLINGFDQRSLTKAFVGQVWKELDATNKTEEKYNAFIKELRKKKLMRK